METTAASGVLLLPFPGAQGHTNPMLQFGRRLAHHGLHPTLIVTRYILSTAPHPGPPFHLAAISDGLDDGGLASCPDMAEYWRRLESEGSDSLRDLLLSASPPVRVLVYDPHLPWARRVAQQAGVAAAAFFSQPCAVDLIYGELHAGRLQLPVSDGRALFARGALGVELGQDDVPPFAAVPESQPVFLKAAIGQFDGLEHADDVLVNSFHDIEPKESKYMESRWRAKTIGPSLPAPYLDDDRLPPNSSYGFDLFTGDDAAACMAWLETQSNSSVLLVSYGTVSTYDEAQLDDLGNALCNSGKPFLWVIRSSEADKLSPELYLKCQEKGGLIVPWCPQLEVLAHKATGSFVTHCGWNSTLEAMVNGVPVVAIPHWADQPTIARYVESGWVMGVRVKPGKSRREEVERCIREVMDGERKDEYRRNASKWMNMAKLAMQQGGSSDKHIAQFAAKYYSPIEH